MIMNLEPHNCFVKMAGGQFQLHNFIFLTNIEMRLQAHLKKEICLTLHSDI